MQSLRVESDPVCVWGITGITAWVSSFSLSVQKASMAHVEVKHTVYSKIVYGESCDALLSKSPAPK